MTSITANVETFKSGMTELKVKQAGEIEDCITDHDDEKKSNEGKMVSLHDGMDDSVHHEGLAQLLDETFVQLDVIAKSYRDFSTKLIGIHRSYEPKINHFFREQTNVFCPLFGVVNATGPSGDTPLSSDAEGDDGGAAAGEGAV